MSQFPPQRTQSQHWQLFIADKAHALHRRRRRSRKELRPRDAIKLVCISDTHNTKPFVPPGDVLLHAGDLSEHGTFAELQAQLDWLKLHPHRYKIFIAGNHDLLLDESHNGGALVAGDGTDDTRDRIDWSTLIYLHDESVALSFPECGGRQLEIYGSPYTPKFGHWAFQYPPKEDIWAHKIPRKIDVLLTHGPPPCHLDMNQTGGHTGCRHLLKELYRARPRVMLFGHIHEARGQESAAFDAVQRVWEDITLNKGRWSTVIGMCWNAMVGLFSTRAEGIQMINAAVVGGRAESPVREAIVIYV